MRTFILYPAVILAWELFLNNGRLRLQPFFFVLILWGYLQYRLCGPYRIKRGRGGRGESWETGPPEQLVTTGPYAYTRNPMYVGHLLFLIGLTLSLRSLLAALITLGVALQFQWRVLHDERRLAERFGQHYIDYKAKVKRWIPGIF